MSEQDLSPALDARLEKGWWQANRWLILRRLSQLGILGLFLLGPWFGIWIVKGNIASSLTLNTLPLSDPLVLLQSLLAGHTLESKAFIGGFIVLAFYLLVGGRVYCAWVCPVNIITDAAHWLRGTRPFKHLGIGPGSIFVRESRYWLLAVILLIAAITGSIAWELVNPISLIYRGLIFGLGMGWAVIVAIFLLDLLISRRAWCGHLCPVGAFYGLIGRFSLIRVKAPDAQQCNKCMDCYAVCPEPQVIKPVLPLVAHDSDDRPPLPTVIYSGSCTNCGRCIDVCTKNVFSLGLRIPLRHDYNLHGNTKNPSLVKS